MKQESKIDASEYYKKSTITLLKELIEAHKALEFLEQELNKLTLKNYRLSSDLEYCRSQKGKYVKYQDKISNLLKQENPTIEKIKECSDELIVDFDLDYDFENVE